MFPCEAFSVLNCCLSADCQAESITQEHKPPQHTDALFQSLNVQQNEFGLVLSLSTSNYFTKAGVCHQYRAFLISRSAENLCVFRSLSTNVQASLIFMNMHRSIFCAPFFSSISVCINICKSIIEYITVFEKDSALF